MMNTRQFQTDLANRLGRLGDLMRTSPARAADELDAMAERLRDAARVIRDRAASAPPRDPGGCSDRVQMTLVGPDGTHRHSTDTNGQES
jgi:hypothetical protein